jgi:hypothetical protein
MYVATRIAAAEDELLKKNPEAIIPPNKKMPAEFSPSVCQPSGKFIPERLRATYSLISVYQKMFLAASSESERMMLVALKAAAEYKWKKGLDDCCRGIKIPPGGYLEILGDWSISILNPLYRSITG